MTNLTYMRHMFLKHLLLSGLSVFEMKRVNMSAIKKAMLALNFPFIYFFSFRIVILVD